MSTTSEPTSSAPDTGGVDAGTGSFEAPRAAPVRFATGALVLFGVTAAIALVLDVVTKYLVVARLTDHPPVRVLGGLVYLDLTRNSGAAFSMGTSYTWVFPLVTLVVIGWIGWMATRLRSRWWALALGLVLGGALGNLGDRLFRAPGFLVGHVVDFISVFGPDGAHFPIFNMADSALSCGVTLAVLLEITGHRRDGSSARATGPSDETSGDGTDG